MQGAWSPRSSPTQSLSAWSLTAHRPAASPWAPPHTDGGGSFGECEGWPGRFGSGVNTTELVDEGGGFDGSPGAAERRRQHARDELRALRRQHALLDSMEAYQSAVEAGTRAAIVLGRAAGAASQRAAVEAVKAAMARQMSQPALTTGPRQEMLMH